MLSLNSTGTKCRGVFTATQLLLELMKSCSTDVLQDARINVLEETSEQVIWFKERFLGDDEIIEHLIVRMLVQKLGSLQ